MSGSSLKGRPRPDRRGPRPHVWKAGPNPITHQQYECWLKAKAQAQFRGEGWDFPFEDWRKIWAPQWHRRGRESDDLCMTRRDVREPWSAQNAMLITRAQHSSRWTDYKVQKKKQKKIERQQRERNSTP